MLYKVHSLWFKLFVPVLSIAILNWSILFGGLDVNNFLENALELIPVISILFILVTALTLALFSSIVFGTRKAALDQARLVRKRMFDILDNFSDSKNNAIRSFLIVHIEPMACMSASEYLEDIVVWKSDIERSLDAIQDTTDKQHLICRYLVALEDEIDLLSYFYIQRKAISIFFLPLIIDSVGIVIFAMLILICGVILSSTGSSIFLANVAVAIIVYTPIQALIVLAFLHLNARDEGLPANA